MAFVMDVCEFQALLDACSSIQELELLIQSILIPEEWFPMAHARLRSDLLCGHFLVCESVGASCSVVISKINMKSVLFFALGVFAAFQTG